ncbi:MAG TPA: NADH:flavin oxidoreductase, partial [Eubacteriaceae bacterium]|nr:NADH:flavin oxidoreductase [Eubacteriaceae bacterium]
PPNREHKKSVAVMGGAPAGIQATLTLCERDHNVTLYEKTGELGGNLLGAAAPAFKTDMKTYLDYLIRQVKRSPAAISYNTEATKELLDEANYDSIVIAVGADPVFPKVPGIDQSHVQWASDADRGLVETGNKIVVIGAGAIGVETAIGLSASGKDVEIIEMAGDLNHLMMNSSNTMEDLMDMIQKQQIPIHLNTRLKEIKSDRIICDHRQTGDETEYFSDTVLLAVGMKPRWDLVDQLRNSAPETEVFVIGDAVEVATLFEAVNSGFKAAAAI